MSAMIRCLLGSAVALAYVAAVAYGGGEKAGVDDTAREISNEELAQMVLSADQFGPEFAGFAPDEENGFQTLVQAAEEEDDPVAEKADLQNFGWSATYEAFFNNSAGSDTGTLALGSTTYLFSTPDGAAGYFQDSVAELDGNSTEDGGSDVLEDAERFDVGVAEEAIGLRVSEQIQRDDGSTADFWGAVVFFRRGRLVAGVAIFGADLGELEEGRLEGKTKVMAGMMNERMTSVLAAGTPAPAAAGQ